MNNNKIVLRVTEEEVKREYDQFEVLPERVKWHRCEICNKIWSCGTTECGEPYVYGLCGSKKCGNAKAKKLGPNYKYDGKFGGFIING